VKNIDVDDIAIVLGLIIMGVGLWWLSPPVSLIVIGLIFLLFGVFIGLPSRNQKRKR